MERAQFMHLLRLSEQASAENPGAYRRSVGAFAALGYVWVLGCVAAALALLGFVGWQLLRGGGLRGYYVWPVLAAGALLLASLRALWLRLDAPGGEVLRREDAPALFDLIERVRAKVQGPPVHQVRLDGDFNASIVQLPRWGGLGGSVNHLTVGLPLLMALDARRLGAVLAHEYGHLRGGHGRFAAWIYRSRLAWARLHEGLRADPGPAGWATNAFLGWYVPRFSARTFALARQDEYEADLASAQVAGRTAAGAALVEIAVKSAWLNAEFWPAHFRAAATAPTPVGPYSAMRRLLAQAPQTAFAQQALRSALKTLPAVDDTHPGLRDRLEALQAPASLPEAWSTQPAMALLADRRRWVEKFDHHWCRDHATVWKRRHAYLARVQQRLQQLKAGAGSASAAQWCEMGGLLLRLDPTGRGPEALACFERALTQSPGLALALRGSAATLPADAPQRLARLTELHEASPGDRWWAAQQAVALLEPQLAAGTTDLPTLQAWRQRLKAAEQAEQAAWQELTESPFASGAAAHDLNEFELGELRADLAAYPHVAQAWLVRKSIPAFPWRRAYLLVLSLPDLGDEDRFALCRELEHTLDLPGTVLVAWREQADALDDVVRRIARSPTYPEPA